MFSNRYLFLEKYYTNQSAAQAARVIEAQPLLETIDQLDPNISEQQEAYEKIIQILLTFSAAQFVLLCQLNQAKIIEEKSSANGIAQTVNLSYFFNTDSIFNSILETLFIKDGLPSFTHDETPIDHVSKDGSTQITLFDLHLASLIMKQETKPSRANTNPEAQALANEKSKQSLTHAAMLGSNDALQTKCLNHLKAIKALFTIDASLTSNNTALNAFETSLTADTAQLANLYYGLGHVQASHFHLKLFHIYKSTLSDKALLQLKAFLKNLYYANLLNQNALSVIINDSFPQTQQMAALVPTIVPSLYHLQSEWATISTELKSFCAEICDEFISEDIYDYDTLMSEIQSEVAKEIATNTESQTATELESLKQNTQQLKQLMLAGEQMRAEENSSLNVYAAMFSGNSAASSAATSVSDDKKAQDFSSEPQKRI